MSAALFALPFNGCCLSPSPEPKPARLERGDRVVWAIDREEGWVISATADAVTICWDQTGYAVYSRCSLAARERIVAIEDDGEDWL
jgi:hypothetical protein